MLRVPQAHHHEPPGRRYGMLAHASGGLRSRDTAIQTGLWLLTSRRLRDPYLSAVRLTRSCALLNLQGSSKGFAQLRGPTDTPVVQKNDPRLFKEHMIVHRNDLHGVSTQCPNDRRHLFFEHGKITTSSRPCLCPLESGPSVVAHLGIDL